VWTVVVIIAAEIAMTTVVVDASALCAVLFGEPEGKAIKDALDDAALVAPALLSFEVANVCVMKFRRHGHSTEMTLALNLFGRLDIAFMAVDLAEVVRLAGETRLTAYDASYLWLAQSLNTELITLDQELVRAHAAVRRG
jgi:predicted nucleic acid-binding protein